MSAASRVVTGVAALVLLGSAATATRGEDEPYTLRRLQPRRSFGRHGIVRALTADGERIDELTSIALDSAGRLVVAGGVVTAPGEDDGDPVFAAAVARLTSDGRLDRTFGGNGIVVLPLGGEVTGLALDRQDRVAIVGPFRDAASSTKTTVVVRLTADGTPDAGFADGGFLRLDGVVPQFRLLRADPRDDGLVAIGFPIAEIVRFTDTGALDPAFGAGGRAPIPAQSLGLAVDAQGRSVVSSEAATVRVLPDGTQDATFGAGGLLRGPLGGAMGSHAVAIDGQQRIVLRGFEGGVGLGVYRFLPTGEPDPSFGVGGVVAIPIAAPGNTLAPEIALGVSHGSVARYAFASTLIVYGRSLSQQIGTFGSLVQAIDPDAPRALASRVAIDAPAADRSLHRGRTVQTLLSDVLVSEDGATAYAVGSTVVRDGNGSRVRQSPVVSSVDLTPGGRVPLPDFTVAWRLQPTLVVDTFFSWPAGSVVVTNRGPGDAANVKVSYVLSDDAVLDPSDHVVFRRTVGPLRSGQSRRLFLDADRSQTPDEAGQGKFLIAVVNGDGIVPETDLANGVAVSAEPIR